MSDGKGCSNGTRSSRRCGTHVDAALLPLSLYVTLLFFFARRYVEWSYAHPPLQQVVRVSETKRDACARGIIRSPMGAEWVFTLPDAPPVFPSPCRCRSGKTPPAGPCASTPSSSCPP